VEGTEVLVVELEVILPMDKDKLVELRHLDRVVMGLKVEEVILLTEALVVAREGRMDLVRLLR
jgi:hypothetical protein